MGMGYTVLIPARLASTRLPNKPLAEIGGAPMVVRVAQRASLSLAQEVVVACDDESIVQACQGHGVRALLTQANHPSGSDRLAEAAQALGLDAQHIVVNVQGDEPFIEPSLIDAVAQTLLQRPDCVMASAAHPLLSRDEWHNPNIVKVVCDAQQTAMYFSRAPIPAWRDEPLASGAGGSLGPATPLRHIGIYAYRVGFLSQFPSLPPAPIEQSEALEQLRALWHGHRIAMHITETANDVGVDTPEDLDQARKRWASL